MQNTSSYKRKYIPLDRLSESVRAHLKRPIVIMGMVGAGKSRLGRMLAKSLSIPFYDCDTELEQSAGRPLAEVRAQVGDAAVRAVGAKILTRLMTEGPCVIAVGDDFVDMTDLAETVFKDAVTLWVQADMDVMVTRITRSPTRPELDGMDIPSYLERMQKKCGPIYTRAALSVRSHEGPAAEVLAQALGALNGHFGG